MTRKDFLKEIFAQNILLLLYRPDLDNLLKRFQDALNKTIFSDVKGHDSCIVELNVKKIKVESDEDASVAFEIIELSEH